MKPARVPLASKVLATIVSVCLAFSFLGVGYLCCAYIPQITQVLSERTSLSEYSVFEQDALVRGAEAARDYSFASHNIDKLYDVIAEMNFEAKTPYTAVPLDVLMDAPYAYTIDAGALSHLDSVYDVACKANLAIAIAMLISVAGMIFLGVRRGKKIVGNVLIASGAGLLAFSVVLVCVGVMNWHLFFNAFHSLLFEAGSWSFSPYSLLIIMLPQRFWMGMGAILAAISSTGCICSIIAGIIIKRQARLVESAPAS